MALQQLCLHQRQALFRCNSHVKKFFFARLFLCLKQEKSENPLKCEQKNLTFE